MRKYLFWIPALLLVLAGCASSPDMATQAPEVVAPTYKIVDHKNMVFGTNAPEWCLKEAFELEQEKDYKGKYVFKFDQSGKDLEGVKLWANGFNAQSQIAKLVNTRVQDKFVGAAAGDKDMLETYMEEVVKILAEARFSGYRQEGDFWALLQYYDTKGKPDRQEYHYYILYTIDKELLDTQIQKYVDGVDQSDKPKTEEEKTARERVKEAFSDGI